MNLMEAKGDVLAELGSLASLALPRPSLQPFLDLLGS